MQIKFNATEEQVDKIIRLFAGFICKEPLENPDGSKRIGALTMGTDGTLYCSTALKPFTTLCLATVSFRLAP